VTDPTADADLDTGLSEGTVETIDSPTPGAALFDGDIGQLPENVRAALLMLLKRTYISVETKPTEYQLIIEHEPALRTRLNDQFLDLVIDREHRVAYKRQAVSESGEKFPTLLYDQAYTREETILLVVLRRMLSGSAVGSVFVDRQDLLDAVERYRPETATDRTGDAKAASNAIENLARSQLLLKTNQPDRFRVPTVLRALLDVRRLQLLLDWLRASNGTSLTSQLSTSGTTTGPAEGAHDDLDADGQDDGDQPGMEASA
jgi:hypothetical protein